MKVNGLQIEKHGSGYQVTIAFHVGEDELAGDWVGDVMAAAAALLNLDVHGAEEPEPEEKPKRRSRREKTGGDGSEPKTTSRS